MKKPVSVSVELDSHRSTCNVELLFTLAADSIEAVVVGGPGRRAAICRKGDVVEWRGYGCEGEDWESHEAGDELPNALLNIIENEYVYPPTNFVNMIQNAWWGWLEGRFNDAQIREELPKLFDWLNELTRIQPDDFWRECQ